MSLALPPVGWQRTVEQPWQMTTVWACEKTVVMTRQPGHLTSMKNDRGAGTRVCSELVCCRDDLKELVDDPYLELVLLGFSSRSRVQEINSQNLEKKLSALHSVCELSFACVCFKVVMAHGVIAMVCFPLFCRFVISGIFTLPLSGCPKIQEKKLDGESLLTILTVFYRKVSVESCEDVRCLTIWLADFEARKMDDGKRRE